MEPVILAIESSCDETAGAILKGGRTVLAEFVASQIDLHRQFGGVVPEVACRAHMECLLPGVQKMLTDSGLSPQDLSAVAVTNRPGLIGALLVGLSAAKSLAYAWNKPLIGVNHIEGHIAAATFAHPEMSYPFVALVVSGGHTNVYHVPAPGEYVKVGGTLDDAAGEAFDKAAKLLDLGFPGGPAIDRAAAGGDINAFDWRDACLPRKNPYDFSFSGLKTAVLYAARGQKAGRKGPLLLDRQGVSDAAASFQNAVVRALVNRTIRVAREKGVKWIAIGGGVAANTSLRMQMLKEAARIGCRLAIPPLKLCTDNAVMIAARATELYREGKFDDFELDASANASASAAHSTAVPAPEA